MVAFRYVPDEPDNTSKEVELHQHVLERGREIMNELFNEQLAVRKLHNIERSEAEVAMLISFDLFALATTQVFCSTIEMLAEESNRPELKPTAEQMEGIKMLIGKMLETTGRYALASTKKSEDGKA